MAESVLKKLLWRLGQSAEVVTGLIQMMPQLKKFQEYELILKLDRIEEDLCDIPYNKDTKDFFDDWRIIIIMLWSKFCQLDHRTLANEHKKRKDIEKKVEKQRIHSQTSFSGRSPSDDYGSKRMQLPSSFSGRSPNGSYGSQRMQLQTSSSGNYSSGGHGSKRMQSQAFSVPTSSGGYGSQSHGDFPKSSDINRAKCRYHSSSSKMEYTGQKCPNCHFEHTNIRDYSS